MPERYDPGLVDKVTSDFVSYLRAHNISEDDAVRICLSTIAALSFSAVEHQQPYPNAVTA